MKEHESQVKKTVSRLSLKQKTSLLSGQSFWHTQEILKKGLPKIMMCDGPFGLRKEVVEDDRQAVGADTVAATCFPPSVNLASTWNNELLFQVGKAIAKEAKQEQVSLLLGPGLNIKRSPLCGRNFEYFSEDPLLSGYLAKSFVEGVQSQGVGACLKHYAVNNQETNRLHINAIVDEQTLREIYLKGFQIALQAKPWAVMCSYNKINGQYASMNQFLLKQVLRDEWHYQGIVVTDWGAVSDRYQGLKYGLDLEMPTSEGYNDRIVYHRYLTLRGRRKYLNQSVYRMVDFILKSQANIDSSYHVNLQDHIVLAVEAATESLVLLKNENHILPISSSESIAVIGEFAQNPRIQGSGSSRINAFHVSNALDVFKSNHSQVTYARGYDLKKDEEDEKLIEEACDIAQKVNKVLLFIGLPDAYESEGYDRKHMHLPKGHLRLLEEVIKVNANVVVILTNGSPVEMPFIHQVKGIVEAYLGGQGIGQALYDVLSGKKNFTGKLAETFPLTLQSNPSYSYFPGENKEVHYQEGIFVGYRYYVTKNIPTLFEFGYGLSYTKYQYSLLRLSYDEIKRGGKIKVSFVVENVGTIAGKEIVQLYLSPKNPKNTLAKRTLVGYQKVTLQSKEQKSITFMIEDQEFMHFDHQRKQYRLDDDVYVVEVGASVLDIRLNGEVKVIGDTATSNQLFTMSSTVYEVCSHPATKEYVFSLLDPMVKAMLHQSTAELYEHYDDDMMASMIMTKPIEGVPAMAFGKVKRYQLKLLLRVLNHKVKVYNKKQLR